MPKIVGKDQSKVKRTTCYKCASILEYFLSEVIYGLEYSYDGSKDAVRYIKCPCCGNHVYV